MRTTHLRAIAAAGALALSTLVVAAPARADDSDYYNYAQTSGGPTYELAYEDGMQHLADYAAAHDTTCSVASVDIEYNGGPAWNNPYFGYINALCARPLHCVRHVLTVHYFLPISAGSALPDLVKKRLRDADLYEDTGWLIATLVLRQTVHDNGAVVKEVALETPSWPSGTAGAANFKVSLVSQSAGATGGTTVRSSAVFNVEGRLGGWTPNQNIQLVINSNVNGQYDSSPSTDLAQGIQVERSPDEACSSVA